jgi:hypothetical protein
MIFDPKSIQRMEDIKRRYPANTVNHCVTMADRITDPNKAFARYQAACSVFGVDSSESKCFLRRASMLGLTQARRILDNQKIIKEYQMAKKNYESALKEEVERITAFKQNFFEKIV